MWEEEDREGRGDGEILGLAHQPVRLMKRLGPSGDQVPFCEEAVIQPVLMSLG